MLQMYLPKIFLRFWLAKIPRISHHNQLLSTKFRRILRYVKSEVNQCSIIAWKHRVYAEEMCLSLEHQNPSKTSEKMGYFDRVTVSSHILLTANQETEGSQDRLTVYIVLFFTRHFVSRSPFGRRPTVTLRATCRAPARILLAVIDFQSGEQQSRSGSDKKRRNRLT